MFVILSFPALDYVTDACYLYLVPFNNRFLFVTCVVTILLPNAGFFYEIIILKKMYPCLIGFSYLKSIFIWLSHHSKGIPVIRETKFPYVFADFDNFVKIGYLILLWAVLLVLQLISLMALSVYFVFYIPYFVVLVILTQVCNQTKAMTINHMYNVWVYFWTFDEKNFKTVGVVDVEALNKSILSEFVLETLPQICLQYANARVVGFDLFQVGSLISSLIIASNGIWRFVYWNLIQKVPFSKIPIQINFGPIYDYEIPMKPDEPEPNPVIPPIVRIIVLPELNTIPTASYERAFRLIDDSLSFFARNKDKQKSVAIFDTLSRLDINDYSDLLKLDEEAWKLVSLCLHVTLKAEFDHIMTTQHFELLLDEEIEI